MDSKGVGRIYCCLIFDCAVPPHVRRGYIACRTHHVRVDYDDGNTITHSLHNTTMKLSDDLSISLVNRSSVPSPFSKVMIDNSFEFDCDEVGCTLSKGSENLGDFSTDPATEHTVTFSKGGTIYNVLLPKRNQPNEFSDHFFRPLPFFFT